MHISACGGCNDARAGAERREDEKRRVMKVEPVRRAVVYEGAGGGGREGMNELNLVKELLDGRGQGRDGRNLICQEEQHHESKVAGGRPRREAQVGAELEFGIIRERGNNNNNNIYIFLKTDDLPRGESERERRRPILMSTSIGRSQVGCLRDSQREISEFGKKVKYVDRRHISPLVHGKLLLLLFILLLSSPSAPPLPLLRPPLPPPASLNAYHLESQV